MNEKKIRIVDIAFNHNPNVSDLNVAIERYKEGLGYTEHSEHLDVSVVIHINRSGRKIVNGIRYFYFKGRNKFFHLPFRAILLVKREQPQFVLVQGLRFPFQVLLLKLFTARSSKIIIQHHGESPYVGLKKYFQRVAGRYVDAYLFTSISNAKKWVNEGIIRRQEQCFEVLEASTYFKQGDKTACKQLLGLGNTSNFLWVGRLDANKDPLTVLNGFELYLERNPGAKLHMVYQTEDILPQVKVKIDSSASLYKNVNMVGRLRHEELESWYNACDFYLSGSHREGSGYALLEAMACGCIPIVTDIPSFRKITADGQYGFLYEKGNAQQLANVLASVNEIDQTQFASRIVAYFKNELSFEKIAADIYAVCKKLKPE